MARPMRKEEESFESLGQQILEKGGREEQIIKEEEGDGGQRKGVLGLGEMKKNIIYTMTK